MKVLFVVPPIYDFAAFDYWMQPYGFLQLAGYLQSKGVAVEYFDFLDRTHPEMHTNFREFNKGKYRKIKVDKPEVISDIKLPFHRYGLPAKIFDDFLAKLKDADKPDAVFSTVTMTYWYQGFTEVLSTVRRFFGEIPVFLGGGYAKLCTKHATQTFKDVNVVSYDYSALKQFLGFEISEEIIENSAPAWDLYPQILYGVMKINIGCPFRCKYCASHVLNGEFRSKPLELTTFELENLIKKGVEDIVFYDDALLVNFQQALLAFLVKATEIKDEFAKQGYENAKNLRFHTPNAIHARLITQEVANEMKRANFATVHLGYETDNNERQKELGNKVNMSEFKIAVENLFADGFEPEQIRAYILSGLPGQQIEEVVRSIYDAKSYGIKTIVSEFSPIPSTELFAKASEMTDLSDPLCQNTHVFTSRYYGSEKIQQVKNLNKRLNPKQ